MCCVSTPAALADDGEHTCVVVCVRASRAVREGKCSAALRRLLLLRAAQLARARKLWPVTFHLTSSLCHTFCGSQSSRPKGIDLFIISSTSAHRPTHFSGQAGGRRASSKILRQEEYEIDGGTVPYASRYLAAIVHHVIFWRIHCIYFMTQYFGGFEPARAHMARRSAATRIPRGSEESTRVRHVVE